MKTEGLNEYYLNVPLGSPSAYLDIQLEIKPGTKKKKIVRNKAITSRAREPAALSIYAPLRRFHIILREMNIAVIKLFSLLDCKVYLIIPFPFQLHISQLMRIYLYSTSTSNLILNKVAKQYLVEKKWQRLNKQKYKQNTRRKSKLHSTFDQCSLEIVQVMNIVERLGQLCEESSCIYTHLSVINHSLISLSGMRRKMQIFTCRFRCFFMAWTKIRKLLSR